MAKINIDEVLIGQKTKKPKCVLVGEDGNVFNVIGRVAKTLNEAEMGDKAKEFTEKAFACLAYHEVLNLCGEYVDIH